MVIYALILDSLFICEILLTEWAEFFGFVIFIEIISTVFAD